MFESSWAHHFFYLQIIYLLLIHNTITGKVGFLMSDMKDRVASFHEEVMHDADFTLSEAIAEAKRCLNCKVPQCRKGCPIENEIPQFIPCLDLGGFWRSSCAYL